MKLFSPPGNSNLLGVNPEEVQENPLSSETNKLIVYLSSSAHALSGNLRNNHRAKLDLHWMVSQSVLYHLEKCRAAYWGHSLRGRESVNHKGVVHFCLAWISWDPSPSVDPFRFMLTIGSRGWREVVVLCNSLPFTVYPSPCCMLTRKVWRYHMFLSNLHYLG